MPLPSYQNWVSAKPEEFHHRELPDRGNKSFSYLAGVEVPESQTSEDPEPIVEKEKEEK